MKPLKLILFVILALNIEYSSGQDICGFCESVKYDSVLADSVLLSIEDLYPDRDFAKINNDSSPPWMTLVVMVGDSISGVSEYYIVHPINDVVDKFMCEGACKEYGDLKGETPKVTAIWFTYMTGH